METISEQAARWAVRANAARLTPVEQVQLDAWLGADTRHRGAYILARARWTDLDRLSVLHGPSTESPGVGEAQAGRVSTSRVPRAAGLTRRNLLSASVAAAALIGGVYWVRVLNHGTRYASDVGEIRRIALEDGSTLLLNTATEVTVHFSELRRDLHLLRGEAIFEVAHDTARPFVVMANGTAIRAVGTAFSLKLESAEVVVTVMEGIVAVDAESAANPEESRVRVSHPMGQLKARERLVVEKGRVPEVSAISAAEVRRQLAWRDGMVSFDGESLETAVAEINRHNRRQIVIGDPDLSKRPLVGVFRATDLEGFATAAAAALQARTVRAGETIRLEPRGGAQK